MDIHIVIKGQYCYFDGDIPLRLLQGIDKALKFEDRNSDFIKSRSDWDGVYHLFNIEYNSFQIGHLQEVKKIIGLYANATGTSIHIHIKDSRKISSKINVSSQIQGKQLLPYQLDSIEAFIQSKIGNIQIPTGGGKTLISAEIVRRLALPTLFIVNRTILLHQTKKEYEDVLGMKIGIIGDGECDIQSITISTIQSLNKKGKDTKVREYLKDVNVVVFDESHFCAAESFQKFGLLIPNAIYRLGLSATVRRDDGKDLMISAVTGAIVYDVEPWVVEQEGIIIRPKCIFIENTDIEEIDDWKMSYDENIVEGEVRNNIIRDVCKQFEGKKILIVVARIAHGQTLQQLIPGSMLVNGTLEKAERKVNLDEFALLQSNVLIGTNSIFATGYNNPAIDVIINAGGNAGFNLTIQTAGRVMRACAEKGKTEAWFIDLLDKGSFHEGHSWARYNALKDKGYDVNVVSDLYVIK